MIGSPVSLPLRDGVELSGLLWTPNGPGPFPALLMRQPYGARIASTVVYAHPSWYAQQGYLVLVLDVLVKEDGETLACHRLKTDAIAQMVAVSRAENLAPGGDYKDRNENG